MAQITNKPTARDINYLLREWMLETADLLCSGTVELRFTDGSPIVVTYGIDNRVELTSYSRNGISTYASKNNPNHTEGLFSTTINITHNDSEFSYRLKFAFPVVLGEPPLVNGIVWMKESLYEAISDVTKKIVFENDKNVVLEKADDKEFYLRNLKWLIRSFSININTAQNEKAFMDVFSHALARCEGEVIERLIPLASGAIPYKTANRL